MALSEEEQRLLEQMEKALREDDPALARTLGGTTPRRLRRRRAMFAGAGFFVGLGLLVGGLQVHPALSIGGFVLMLAATVVAITAWNTPTRIQGKTKDGGRKTASVRSDPGSKQQRHRDVGGGGFMDKMEERWRRRQEDGH